MPAREPSRRFVRIATAGAFFQGGAAAVDTGTIMASLVHGLTGSSVAVGAAAAIARYGWLFPQLFVAWFAQARRRRMPFYALGAFGRVVCLIGVAGIVLIAGPAPTALLIVAFFALWTLYGFVGGILAVPYNDIVARSIPSARRSRLLALRFFAGGLLALGVAAVAGRAIDALAFPGGHAVVLLTGAGLLLVSAISFVSAGEPLAPEPKQATGFGPFLREGLDVFRQDRRFRLFVGVRWLDGTVMMALPFYVVAATEAGVTAAEVATLLGAQTAGALLSNPLWGWWGDRLGKRRLLGVTAVLAIVAPLLTVLWMVVVPPGGTSALPAFAAVFLVLGAMNNGGNIAHLGYLWEISPDDRRPAYSGYFNALVAPAALSPIAGAAVVEAIGLSAVFVAGAVAAVGQVIAVHRLRHVEEGMMAPCS